MGSSLCALCITFFAVISSCDSAELEVLIGGMSIGRTASCVGETVTYVCTVPSNAHKWIRKSDSFTFKTIVIAGGGGDAFDNGFIFQGIFLIDGHLTSAVTVFTTFELNGVVIVCEDGEGSEEEQTVTAVVFASGGRGLNVKQNSAMLTSFDFDTSPCINGPSYNHISATPTDKSGTTHDVITFNQPPFSFTESGFDVCQYTYSFTAVPDDGESINTEQNPTDFTAAAPITQLRSTSDGIMWSAPANAKKCSFKYVITLDANPDFSLTVNKNSVSYTALSDGGFNDCMSQAVTVIPVVPINNQRLGGSSATMELGMAAPNTTATVDKLDIMFMWNAPEVDGFDQVTIQHDSETSMPVDYTEGQHTVSLACSSVGKTVPFTITFSGSACDYTDTMSVVVGMGDDCYGTGGGEGSLTSSAAIGRAIMIAVIQGLLAS